VRAPRRARRSLLTGIVLFLAFQAAFNVAVRCEWLPLRDPVYAEKLGLLHEHPAFFAAESTELRLLVLGSSRTMLAVDAKALSESLSESTGRPVTAFNFGTSGGGPMTNALYLRRLLAAGCRPDAVLVELHPALLANDTEGAPFEGRWLHAYRMRAEEVERLNRFGYPVAKPPHLGWKGWLTATYAYRLPLLNAAAPRWLPCPYGLTLGARADRFGWVGGLEVTPEDRRIMLRSAFEQYAPVFADYRPAAAPVEALRDTLAVCRAAGVRAAVVVTAESSEFRGWYGPAGAERITTLAREFGGEFGVPVYDAREWVADDGFADGHHMNPAGAKTFTARLASEAGPWVRCAEGR
jgi:hypothetical protein